MSANRIQLAELLGFVSEQVRTTGDKAKSSGRLGYDTYDVEPVTKLIECEIDFAIEMETDEGIHVWTANLGFGTMVLSHQVLKQDRTTYKHIVVPDEPILGAP